jgi:TetR/AcrR family transcriptional regulator, fatty acid metabolism regulator protein
MSTHRSLKERQRQEREDLILQVAEEVILQKGYRETGMDEIAARVGIAKGTLYLHFARKEDLIFALVKKRLLALAAKMEKIYAGEGTPQARLEAVLHLQYEGNFRKHSQFLTSMNYNEELHTLFKEKHDELETLLGELTIRIKALFDEGKARGDFDAAIPTEIMYHLFLTMLTPRLYKTLVLYGTMKPDELVSSISRVFFTGIAADPKQV